MKEQDVAVDQHYNMFGWMLGVKTSDGQTLGIAYDEKNRVESMVQKLDSSKVETTYVTIWGTS